VKRAHGQYEIDDDARRLDFARLHDWLTHSYWSPGITRDRVERAAAGSSLVVGSYLDDRQVGYLRVVSDRATFAWIADVFVVPEQRGHGLGKFVVATLLEHPELQGVRRVMLGTEDAHELYRRHGFTELSTDGRMMGIRRDPTDIYGP